MIQWSHFPELHTPRLVLRSFEQADLPQVYFGLSHPDVIRYYGVSYTSLEHTQEQMDWFKEIYERGTGIWWAITSKQAPGELLGACGLNNWNQQHHHAEIGYWLLPQQQRNGLMTEALEKVIQFAFNTMQLHRIVATVEKENMSSIWMLEKNHFVQEGVLREAELKQGRYIDLIQYSLINPHKSV